MDTYLLGIDAGTTSMKAVLFDERGRAVASALEEYRLLTPAPEIVELDAETYWNAFKTCTQSVVRSSGVPPGSIRALTISSQGESFVPVGKDGETLRNAIVWLDNRSGKEADRIRERFGAKKAYHISGSPEIVPTWASTKMLWLKENEPDVFARAEKFLFVEDYLIFKLTGQFVGETALYCSSLLMDINTGAWWEDLLGFIGVEAQKLPRLTNPGEVVAGITSDAARATGLSEETAVVTGGMDQACGSVGSGNIRPGIVTETTGASLNICATTDEPVYDPKMRIPCQVHCMPGKFIVLPWCQTAGMALKWFRDEFCRMAKARAREEGADAYDLLAAEAGKAPPGSNGLLLLPHLAGAMCPELNPSARGVFFGIGLDTTKGHFVRAIMESVAFMLRANLEAMAELGIEAGTVIALGGGARSDLWNQIKADVLNKPVAVLDNPEAACLGAAIVGGKATGVFDSIEEACARMVSVKETFEPNARNRDVYESGFAKYQKLYQRLEPLF